MSTLYWSDAIAQDGAWENHLNWWTNAAATMQALNAPWLDGTDTIYLAYNLAYATGETDMVTMDVLSVGLNFGTGATGVCNIADIQNNGTIGGGEFTGNEFNNHGTINAGIFSNPTLNNGGTITGGTYIPAGTVTLGVVVSGSNYNVTVDVPGDPGFAIGGGTYAPVYTMNFAGTPNLSAGNIKSGIDILGVIGTATASAGAGTSEYGSYAGYGVSVGTYGSSASE